METEGAEDLVRGLERVARFVYAGREVCPTTGQLHYQGYCQLKAKRRVAELVRIISCHWEPAGGSLESNRDYCGKSGDVLTFGVAHETDAKSQGNHGAIGGAKEKARWKRAYEAAKKGKFDDIDPQIMVCHYGAVKNIAKDNLEMPQDIGRTAGVWFYGEAGMGKSSMARQQYPDSYFKMCNKWWDSYKGQPNVIIDDFDKSHSCLGHHLKIWADRYAFLIEVKNGAMAIRPEWIVVTSQYHPEQIWEDKETREAILRRFKVTRIGPPEDAPEALKEAHKLSLKQSFARVVDLTGVIESSEGTQEGEEEEEAGSTLSRVLPIVPLRRC